MIKSLFTLLILYLAINLSVEQGLLPEIPYPKFLINPTFYFHSREERNVNKNYEISADDLTSLKSSTFDTEKKTIFVVHGFSHSAQRKWVKNMTAELLNYGDYNVIRVDYALGALTVPDISIANAKVVGEEMARFIKVLKDELQFDPNNVHCIGHSLGGYVCAYLARAVQELTGIKIGRITALDPGGYPWFIERRLENRLDPSDADFVDVIHTETKLLNILPGLGDPDPLGHIDIYVNGGHNQPGCEPSLGSILDLNNNGEESVTDLVINEVFCSHIRSIEFYIESLVNPSCQWIAYECPSFELFQQGECTTCGEDNSKCAFLGPRVEEYVDKSREYVVMYIATAGGAPYCAQHYVVSVSTGIVPPCDSVGGGVLIFEVIGDNGSFIDKFQISRNDIGETKKRLFLSHIDVGDILSVSLTWKSQTSLLGLIKINSNSNIGVISIKVSPLTHYPDSEKSEVVIPLSSDGLPTPISNGETKTFTVDN